MALTLSSERITAFTALQYTLLSPLEHESVDAWCASVTRGAERLLDADRSAFFLPCPREHHYVSESIDPVLLRAYEERIADVEAGALRYREDGLERIMASRRAMGLEVWSVRGLAHLAGVPLEGQPVYHEVVQPAGIAHGRVITVQLERGETFLGVSHSNPRHDPFEEGDGFELISLLLPAFKAGVGTIVRMESQREQFARTLDDLDEAVAILTGSGQELHRSARLRELLEAEPERQLLGEHIKWMANEVDRIRTKGRGAQLRVRGQRQVDTAAGRYVLRASRVGDGVIGPRHVILVSVECVTLRLPSAGTLVERAGLTQRQAEVALLLARGLSNQEIADRLGISHHTVRHHAEWVFAKLSVQTRKALGLRLLEWARDGI